MISTLPFDSGAPLRDGAAGPASRLRHGTVLVISPQPWGHIPVSKHHYAIELARRGNRVFFLEPPGTAAMPVRIAEIAEHPGLAVVQYGLAFPGVLRFHVRPLFDWLMRRQVARLRAALGRPLDAVWCFEPNLFSDLRWFGAPCRIYHPVDPVVQPSQVRPAHTATLVLSVSEAILTSFRPLPTPSRFLNHGLAEAFVHHARAPHATGSRDATRASPRIGYTGNLLHPSLDAAVIRRMVEQNPRATFHFWGPFTDAESGIIALPEQRDLVGFLLSAANVRLRGRKSPEQLAADMQEMDAFVLAYTTRALYDGSNSHKILEYLSTGKVIVSSHVSTYADRAELIVMARKGGHELPELLQSTIARLDEQNSPARQETRRQYALDHTYARQVERVTRYLADVCDGRLEVTGEVDMLTAP